MDMKHSEGKHLLRAVASHVWKTAVSVVVLAVALAGAVAMLWFREPPAKRTPDQLVPLVRVAAIEPFSGSLSLTVSGTVVPHREVRLAAEVSGRIATKTPQCRAGNRVQTGDVLVVIDRENYELALRTAEAELEQSRIMVSETDRELEWLRENVRLAREQVALLEEEFSRNERLGGVVSRSELDQSKRALLDARTQLASRENTLSTTMTRVDRMTAAFELASRRVERARLDLARTEIRAPFPGVIARDLVEQDDFVQVGTPLIQLEDTELAEVICNLTDNELRWIRRHAPASFPGQTSAESGPWSAYLLPPLPVNIQDPRDDSATWSGRLDRFDGIGRDELTKAIPVRIVVSQPVIEVDGESRALVRGMFVRCTLEIGEASGSSAADLLAVPSLAIRPGGFVWVLEGDRIRKVPVARVDRAGASRRGHRDPGLAICRLMEGGLRPGDRVVVSPLSQPTDGMIVSVEESRSTAPDQPPADAAAADSEANGPAADTGAEPQSPAQ